MTKNKTTQYMCRTRILLSIFFILLIFYSCTKIDTNEKQMQDNKLIDRFFTVKNTVSPKIDSIILKLKLENESTNFVINLPKNCGLPIWDKIQFKSKVKTISSSFSQTSNYGSNSNTDSVVLIPLSINNENLSSIIVFDAENTNNTINCFTVSNNLFSICNNSNIPILEAQNLLGIFMGMENNVYGTTKFYHIPARLFKNPSLPDTATVEHSITISMEVVTGFAANDCFVIKYCNPGNVCEPSTGYCDNCSQCPWEYYCTTPPGGGGSGSGGSGGGTGSGGSGGDGGGGGSGGGNPPCDDPSGRAWYSSIVAPPNPCDNPPPTVFNDTILVPCNHTTTLGNNAEFKNMMQDLKNHSNDATDNKEHGWVFKNTNGIMTKDSITGLEGEKGIDSIPINSTISGLAHNHFNNSLSIFSPDDLWAISTIFREKKMDDSAKFTLPLVTAQGTQYLLMIENVTKFRAWAKKFTELDLDLYKRVYGLINNIKESNTNQENEKKFLLYLKQLNGGSGLKLFSGNTNFTTWTPLGLDNDNNVVAEACP